MGLTEWVAAAPGAWLLVARDTLERHIFRELPVRHGPRLTAQHSPRLTAHGPWLTAHNPARPFSGGSDFLALMVLQMRLSFV